MLNLVDEQDSQVIQQPMLPFSWLVVKTQFVQTSRQTKQDELERTKFAQAF
jgi:hypothetical protein